MTRYALQGKVALVTGAARGIGFETAKQLHERGASVAVLDLDAGEVAAAVAQIGGDTLGIAADVTDKEAMNAAVTAVAETFGGLDIAVANAGIAPPGATMRVMDADAWERVLEIDLLGIWRTVKPSLEEVCRRQGHVVVVSSVYAWMNPMAGSAYGVAKAGVESLGRALRVELAQHGASATVAHFGFIDTRMVQDTFDTGQDPVSSGLLEVVPAWARKRLTPAQAAAGIVDAIEGRKPRVILPSWWKVSFALRGVLNPLLDRVAERREGIQATMRLADADERAAARGQLEEVARKTDTAGA